MGRRTVLAGVLLVAAAFLGMPPVSADICNGTCDGSGGGGRRGGGGLPGSAAPGSFSINNASVTEGESQEGSEAFKKLVFTVTLTGGGAASVKFATEDGTASSSGISCDGIPDYEPKTGTLKFSGPGQKKVRVTVNNDFCFEDTENMFVNLTNPQGATIADGKGKGTIRDDDNQGD